MERDGVEREKAQGGQGPRVAMQGLRGSGERQQRKGGDAEVLYVTAGEGLTCGHDRSQ